MRKRTLARESALKILYQAEIARRQVDESAHIFWSEIDDIDKEIKTFSDRLTDGIHKNLKVIDETISVYAANWQLKRMAVIDRNVLRIGVFELNFLDDIPPKASINEAIDLAKKYGDTESGKFVNGILDKIHKTQGEQVPDEKAS